MKIAFHSNQLSLRGTETAMYDYAHYNEVLLGNQSIIVTPRQAPGHHELSAQRFASRFSVYGYDNLDELERLLQAEHVDTLYCIKAGFNDGIIAKETRTVVHSVFGYCEPHGAVYAYVSPWLSRFASEGKHPAVPHIVTIPEATGDLRQELGIPGDAIVFGRHGGSDSFDVQFAHVAIQEIAKHRDDIYFLFLGTNQFCEAHPRIIHLPATADVEQKTRFIYSCDAMLHARLSGETFGLAIAEFSALNKPIITYDASHERAHIEILGERGFYYSDVATLTSLLWTFTPQPSRNWRVYSTEFPPEKVMKIFKEVFLESAL